MGDSSTVVHRSITVDVKSCRIAKGQVDIMAIIHRRVFQAKIGQSAPLVEHFQEAVTTMKSHGINWNTRISSDYHCGRSDRVSVEWLLDGLSDIDADITRGRYLRLLHSSEHVGEDERYDSPCRRRELDGTPRGLTHPQMP